VHHRDDVAKHLPLTGSEGVHFYRWLR
jgi:hypothetical protein